MSVGFAPEESVMYVWAEKPGWDTATRDQHLPALGLGRELRRLSERLTARCRLLRRARNGSFHALGGVAA
ncbi:hypothetical protein [Streptomyces sp. NPDC002516]